MAAGAHRVAVAGTRLVVAGMVEVEHNFAIEVGVVPAHKRIAAVG